MPDPHHVNVTVKIDRRELGRAIEEMREAARRSGFEQPAEPSPPSDADVIRDYGPKRWAAFTDDELEALADAVAYADGSTYGDQRWRFAQEIDREQQRRRRA